MDTSLNNDCPYCGGYGLVHPCKNGVVDYASTIPCSCMAETYKKRRYETLLKYCELPPLTESMTFASFRVFPEVKRAFAEAKEMSAADHIWATFMGANDTGKTHLAVSVCRAWIKRGLAAKYCYVSLLLDELKEGFRRPVEDGYDVRFKAFCNVPLLVLDDLGAEYSTPWVLDKLETLVDYRYMNNLSLIVTTNKQVEELSPRLASRLVRHPHARLIDFGAEEYTLRRTKAGVKSNGLSDKK